MVILGACTTRATDQGKGPEPRRESDSAMPAQPVRPGQAGEQELAGGSAGSRGANGQPGPEAAALKIFYPEPDKNFPADMVQQDRIENEKDKIAKDVTDGWGSVSGTKRAETVSCDGAYREPDLVMRDDRGVLHCYTVITAVYKCDHPMPGGENPGTPNTQYYARRRFSFENTNEAKAEPIVDGSCALETVFRREAERIEARMKREGYTLDGATKYPDRRSEEERRTELALQRKNPSFRPFDCVHIGTIAQDDECIGGVRYAVRTLVYKANPCPASEVNTPGLPCIVRRTVRVANGGPCPIISPKSPDKTQPVNVR
ncbi:hypothetical protein BH11PLA1_BH11PLA1_15780 [soil metagenome]